MSLQTRCMSKQFLGTCCSRMYGVWTGQGFSSRGLQGALSGKRPWTAPCHLQSCPVTLTPMVHTRPSTGQRSTEYSCLNTRKKKHQLAGTGDMWDSLRDSQRERLQRGHVAGDVLCAGQVPCQQDICPWGTAAMSHPHQGKDTPEGLQLWATHSRATHTRAGTALRDHKQPSLGQTHWEAKKSSGKSAGSKEEQQKETIRHTTFLSCPSPRWRSRRWAKHNLQWKPGKPRWVGRDIWLKLKVTVLTDSKLIYVEVPRVETVLLITFSQNTFTRLQRIGSHARAWKSSFPERKRFAPGKMILSDEDYYYYCISLTQLSPDEIQVDCSERFKTARVKAESFLKCRGPHHMHQITSGKYWNWSWLDGSSLSHA